MVKEVSIYISNVQAVIDLVEKTSSSQLFFLVIDAELGETEYIAIQNILKQLPDRLRIVNPREKGALYPKVKRVYVSSLEEVESINPLPGQDILVNIVDNCLSKEEFDRIHQECLIKDYIVLNRYEKSKSWNKMRFNGVPLIAITASVLVFFWWRKGCPPLRLEQSPSQLAFRLWRLMRK